MQDLNLRSANRTHFRKRGALNHSANQEVKFYYIYYQIN